MSVQSNATARAEPVRVLAHPDQRDRDRFAHRRAERPGDAHRAAADETARLDDPETATLGAHTEADGDARSPGPVGELTLAERRLGDARAQRLGSDLARPAAADGATFPQGKVTAERPPGNTP